MKIGLTVLVVFTLSSCVSTTIAGKGKPFSHLESSDVSRSSVISELGNPIGVGFYQKPLKISKTQEYQRAVQKMSAHSADGEDWLLGCPLNSGDEEAEVSRCDVYACQGYFERPFLNAHFELMSGMTLGIADVFMIPGAIVERISRSKRTDYLTIWYDQDEKYAASSLGNWLIE